VAFLAAGLPCRAITVTAAARCRGQRREAASWKGWLAAANLEAAD
jgi:hypothetical protein